MTHRVSVVIPNRNGSMFLRQAIESVLVQDMLDVDLIVVDDGSTDDSRKILESYGNQIRVFYEKDKGAPAARNLGWKNAKAEFIKFLDADDELLKGALHKQVGLASGLEPAEIPFGEVMYMDEKGVIFNDQLKYRKKSIQESPLAYILRNNPLTSCPLHRKSLLEKIHGFNEALPKGQEWDLHLRLFLAGVQFNYHSEFVYKFREYNDPKRFSMIKYAANGPEQFLGIFNHQLKLIQDVHQSLNKFERKLIAQRYWAYGRAVLREGFENSAEKYFQKAKGLAGNQAINGSLLYKILFMLSGPYLSEKLLMKIK